MTSAELDEVGANNINERGHSFRYSLGAVKEITPKNIDGVSKLWAIQILSPELSALRKSYGLSSLPKDEAFHITVAVRRKNVLRDNDISKCDDMSASSVNKPTFNHPSSRGELKAAADAETTYECNCSGRCTCPPSCICKKSCCDGAKTAAHEGAPWGTPTDKLPWRERVEVYAHDPKGRIYGGIWNTDKSFAVPGGGIDPGEDPGQAALRELEEETGIKATNPRVLPIAPVDNAWSDKHRQEKQRNFAGSRTHFVAVDILNKLRRKNLDKWDADQRKMYDPAAAETMMASHTNFMAPSVAAGRLAALRHIIANAAKKTAADLLPGGAADNTPDSKFPKKDLVLGVKDEREHTSNDQIANEIAKDHLQEDAADYEKEKLNFVRKTPQILLQLRAAKAHSDNKRYDQKNHILRQLMSAAPQDWVVDDPKPYHMGITHAPTNFRFHADPKIIPPVVQVSKAASKNPYIAQLFSTAPSFTPGNTTWQNVVQHLRNVKTRGDQQAFAEQNSQGLLAELNPEYKQQLHSQIISKNYPRPDFLTRMIQQHGDSALNAVS
jgi:8-oxo-dGTP pyrophosphatase MutT (NUDIX family)